MIMIFETEHIFRKVTGVAHYFGPDMGYLISGNYTPISYDEENETMKYEKIEEILATRISQFRNGIAIYYYSFNCNAGYNLVNSYLVDSQKNVLYFSQEREFGNNLIRAFGGFYVLYGVRESVRRTFPGQDRDTEYDLYPEIRDIITEDGKVLTREERETFLMYHKILPCEEIEDGVIKCEGKLYSLHTYLPIHKSYF